MKKSLVDSQERSPQAARAVYDVKIKTRYKRDLRKASSALPSRYGLVGPPALLASRGSPLAESGPRRIRELGAEITATTREASRGCRAPQGRAYLSQDARGRSDPARLDYELAGYGSAQMGVHEQIRVRRISSRHEPRSIPREDP